MYCRFVLSNKNDLMQHFVLDYSEENILFINLRIMNNDEHYDKMT
jgi:hypothetical protein